MSFESLAAAAGATGRLVSTPFARGHGVEAAELAQRRRRGDVLLVRAKTWLIPSSPDWVHEVAEEAAGRRAAVSHAAAAVLQGVPILGWDGATHLTVERNRSRVSSPYEVHRSDLGPADVGPLRLRVGDDVIVLKVTAPARLAVDLARAEPQSTAVAAIDSLMRLGLLRMLAVIGERRALWGRDASRVSTVLGLVNPRAGSVLESLFRVLVVLAGMPPGQTQRLLRRANGRRLGRVDFWYPPRLVVETEGDLFHGLERLAVDEWRANELEILGLQLLRFCWQHVVHEPDYVLATLAEMLRP
ncbi:MAG TPA: DUF559 domain-containing protein [Mycobacteriales bacterium]|nr:DUF559 domain-containing protein [Mycobacteriales bacterium]